jgi:hypothetical protein
MKWLSFVIALAIVVLTVAPVTAQQSLGDVAGSIKLNRPEGESVVIDQNTLGKAPLRQTNATRIDLFRDVLGDCLIETTTLHDLIFETRDGSSFYRDPWRARVAEVVLRLDGVLEELGLFTVDGRYQEAYDLAVQGSDLARDALVILRAAIAEDRPVFSESRTMSKEAVRYFKDAQTALGAASRSEAAEEPAGLINPIEADRVMTSLCGGQHADGSSAFDSCVAEQRAAVDAMAVRSGPGVGLDAASFNIIRNNCRFEWPNNYVTQDRCERNRIAAGKLRQ